jgi:hypothetical protein
MNSNRGEWVLVQAYNKHPEYERLRNQHTAEQHRQNSRSPLIPPLDHVANNSGFIILKDSKVVVFYSNDLLETPPDIVLHGSNETGQSSVCMGCPLFLGGWAMKFFIGQIFRCLHQ